MSDPKEDEFFAEAEEALEEMAEAQAEAEQEELDEITALMNERDAFKDKYMRALAEADNARKRAAKDRQEANAFGGSRIARDLLPVYDNLNRALQAAKEDDSEASVALVEGVQLTLKELLNVFDRHGVSRITPEVGDRFDPKEHEAMFEAPLPGTKAGDIIQVSAEGFMLNDRLLRPAQVGVSSMTG